ncbi:MAG TPA: hypothetical protein VKN99_11335 [Polyangia bacterium]|nr:hypothetical protein [Polyangia bacterium]
MSDANQDLKQELKRGLELLKTLRDEIRLDLHLAGMEARDQWTRLEPRIAQLEKRGQELGAASKQALDELLAAAKRLRDSLRKPKG